MKNIINHFKKIEKTKRFVIVFITISFVFIIGIGCYNAYSNTGEDIQKDNISLVNHEEEKTSLTDDQQKIDNTKTQQEQAQKETSQQTTTKQNSQTTKKTTQKSTQTNSTTQKDNSTSHSKQESTQIETDKTVEKEKTITVSVKVEGVHTVMMSGEVELSENASVYDALVKLASKNNKKVSGSSSYITGIGDLYEKDYGPLSGWMYKVNGTSPQKGAGSYKLSNNDQVLWYYVNYE